MKKITILIAFLALIATSFDASSQVLSESAKRKVTVGVDIFTDIMIFTNDPAFLPPDFSFRTINQGATAFVMYNMTLGQKQNSSFSIGLGIRNHNLYSNSFVRDIKGDSIIFETIERDYKKSKVNLVYLDLPVEFRFKTEGGFKLSAGFKVGYNIDSKEKYKGNRPEDTKQVKVKTKGVYQIQDWTFGPTLRLGYKWVSIYAYYQVTEIFETGRGPEMNPISVGITITPF